MAYKPDPHKAVPANQIAPRVCLWINPGSILVLKTQICANFGKSYLLICESKNNK
jgi:hypothetical protein